MPLDLYQNLTRLIGLTVIVVSSLVLLGWAFDLPTLKSLITDTNNRVVNTSLGFLFSGVSILQSLMVRRKPICALLSRICAGLVLLIGLLTLAEYVFDRNYGIEELLIGGDADRSTYSPERMSLMTAVNFSLLGFVLLLGNSQSPIKLRIIELAALTVLGTASVALLGYLYHLEALYKVSLMSSMALPTALLFAVLSIAVLLVHPRLQSNSWRYGLAAIVVILAFGLRLELNAWLGSGLPPFILFFPAYILYLY